MAQARHLAAKSDTLQHPDPARVKMRLSERRRIYIRKTVQNNFTEHSPAKTIICTSLTFRTLVSFPERPQKCFNPAKSPWCAGSSEPRSRILILVLLDQMSDLIIDLHHPEPPEVVGLAGGGLAPPPSPPGVLLHHTGFVHMETRFWPPKPGPLLHVRVARMRGWGQMTRDGVHTGDQLVRGQILVRDLGRNLKCKD